MCLVGIERGSYGAGLARYIAAAGIRVVEVDRSAAPISPAPAAATRIGPARPLARNRPAGAV